MLHHPVDEVALRLVLMMEGGLDDSVLVADVDASQG